MEIINSSILYVMNGYLFWHTMGFTIATSIFVGAAIYDGDTSTLKKGVITIGTYAGFLLLLNAGRLLSNPANLSHIQRYAGTISIAFITIAYIIGLVVGVLTVNRVRAK